MTDSGKVFIEEFVKGKETVGHKALRIGAIIGIPVTAVFAIIGIFTIIAVILCIACIIITFIMSGSGNIEYEYSYTTGNGSLDIAKIINDNKRKAIISVDPTDIRQVAAEGTNEYLKYDHVELKEFDCSAQGDEHKKYVLIGHDNKKGEDYKIFFNPSEELIEAMKKYNKREIFD